MKLRLDLMNDNLLYLKYIIPFKKETEAETFWTSKRTSSKICYTLYD